MAKRRRIDKKFKDRLATNIADAAVDIINGVRALGRQLLPPIGTIMEFVPPDTTDAGWRFTITHWEREQLQGVYASVITPVTGLRVRYVSQAGTVQRGEHLLTLDLLKFCEIIEIPTTAPHFTSWPLLSDMKCAVPDRLRGFGLGGWTVANTPE